MITIKVEPRTALVLALAIMLLAFNVQQAVVMAKHVYALTRSIHFNLVQAPMEAAFNAAKAEIDKALGGE